MGILVAFVSLLRTLPSAGQPVPPSLDGGLVLVALAFVAICLLAGMAAATLRDQADEIAALRRHLVERHGAL
jgi:hypothetical protein